MAAVLEHGPSVLDADQSERNGDAAVRVGREQDGVAAPLDAGELVTDGGVATEVAGRSQHEIGGRRGVALFYDAALGIGSGAPAARHEAERLERLRAGGGGPRGVQGGSGEERRGGDG